MSRKRKALWENGVVPLKLASKWSTQYEFQNTIFDASGRRNGTHNSVRGKAGSILNMITETKNEHKVDGDGRPVVELKGSRQFHVNTPPSGELEVEPWKLQVWSTVIGASLTTVMPSGGKSGSFLLYCVSQRSVTSYSPIINADGDGDLAEDELATETIFDGAGRVLKTRTANPNSIGGYTGRSRPASSF